MIYSVYQVDLAHARYRVNDQSSFHVEFVSFYLNPDGTVVEAKPNFFTGRNEFFAGGERITDLLIIKQEDTNGRR